MEKDFQAFLSRLTLESVELPSLNKFFRSLFLYYYLFPSSNDKITSDKKSFISQELQVNISPNLLFILKSFSTDINPSIINYLKINDWWWDYLLLFKRSKITIYQLSSVHESTMTVEDKKSSGVYFTPEPQIEFICKYSLYKQMLISRKLKIEKTALIRIIFLQRINGAKKKDLRLLSQIICNLKVIDPSCGSGLFLHEMKMIIGSLLRILTSNNIISSSEYHEYLQILQVNLTGYDINRENIIFTKFVLLSTCVYLQPERRQDFARDFERAYIGLNQIYNLNFLQTSFPHKEKYDICIGNPPYLRHHDFDNKRVVQSITSSEVLQNAINKHKLKFDSKADLYVYFWIKGMTLLSLNGVFGFVLSRSWYSSRFMTPINKLIAKEEFFLDLILELPLDPWNKAQVRTNIVFGHRSTSKQIEQVTNTLVWKKSLLILINHFSEYVNLFTSDPKGFISKHNNQQILSEETDFYRFSSTTKIKILFSQDYSFSSPMMRLDYYTIAPFLIHDVLLSQKAKFCLLKNLGKSSLGSTTGANAYFYLDEHIIANYGLSSEYLVPMTKSPKDAVSISDFTARKKLRLLHITPHLEIKNHPNLTKYLEEIQDRILARPYFQNKSKNDWYKINLIQPDLIIPNMTFLRSFVAYNKEKLHIDKQWIGFWAYEEKWILSLLGFMNSSLGVLLREVQGTRTLGLGSLKLSLSECLHLLVIDPKLIPKPILDDIIKVTETLLDEPIPAFGEKTKYTEIQQHLDEIICIDYLGFEPSFLEKIRKALVFEVEWRLGKSIK
ncbi:MAG: Eco57I restriction-modification methylase domain-containing protein [Candidatus Hodarchaeales archaeon]|jgi:hypothetical protein